MRQATSYSTLPTINHSMHLVQNIISSLEKYPDIKFDRKNETELKIFGDELSGFDITLFEGGRENILYLGNFHWHFDNTETEIDELVDKIFLALIGEIRVKEFSKDGKSYKWVLQIRDANENWSDTETTGLLNLRFGQEADIAYYQNKLILTKAT